MQKPNENGLIATLARRRQSFVATAWGKKGVVRRRDDPSACSFPILLIQELETVSSATFFWPHRFDRDLCRILDATLV
jgi:hypothetical protein